MPMPEDYGQPDRKYRSAGSRDLDVDMSGAYDQDRESGESSLGGRERAFYFQQLGIQYHQFFRRHFHL